MRCTRALVVGLVSFSGLSPALSAPFDENLAGHWFDATQTELREVSSAIDLIGPEVTRLEEQLRIAKVAIRDQSECETLDCGDIATLLLEAQKIETSANTSLVLNGMALRQLSDYSEAQSATVLSLSKGRSTLRLTLQLQQMGQSVAELSAGVAAALITGDVKDVGKQLSVLAAMLANYGVNSAVNSQVGQRDFVGGSVSSAVGAERVSDAHAKLVSSLSAHLTTVGVFQPGQGMRLSFKPKVLNLSAADVSSITTRAFVAAITETFVGETRQQLGSAISEHEAAIAGHRDALLAVVFQKIAMDEFKEKRRDLLAQIGRLRTLAGDCRATVSSINCSDGLEARLDDVETRYDMVKQAAYTAQEAAIAPITRARDMWAEAFEAAVTSHDALQIARDRLSEAKRLNNERGRLEELARGARNADKREQYQAELAKLDALGDISVLESEVARLKTQRAGAWELLDQTEADIEVALPSALAAHENAATQLVAAEISRNEGIAAARTALYDCLESSIPDASAATSPERSVLRARVGDSVDPGVIFVGLRQGLASFKTKISSLSIRSMDEEGAPCQEEMAAVIDNPSPTNTCWAPLAPDGVGPTWLEKSRLDTDASAELHLAAADVGAWGYDRIINERLVTSPGVNRAMSVGVFAAEGNLLTYSYVDQQAVQKRFPWFSDQLSEKLVAVGATDRFELEEVVVPEGGSFSVNLQTGEWSVQDGVETVWLDGYKDTIIVGSFLPLSYEHYFDSSTFYYDKPLPAGAVEVSDGHYLVATNETVPVAFGQTEEPWRHANSPHAINEAGEPLDEPLSLGQDVGLEIQSDRNCPGRVETIDLRIEPSENPGSSKTVQLVETAADSGLYRLPNGTAFTLDFSADEIGVDGGIYLYPNAYIGRRDDPRRHGEFVSVSVP